MISIGLVGVVGVPPCYGGFETLVDNLIDGCESKNRFQFTVYCSSKSYPEKLETYKNAMLKYIPLEANGIQSVVYDIWAIFHAVYSRADTVLILGVSGAICLPVIKMLSGVRILINIDGLEWRRDKWGWFTKKYLKFSEKMAVKYSDVVIADNQAIADYVEAEYGVESEVIAYGGDHAVTDEIFPCDGDYALALCRIEPENNVQLILNSFCKTNKNLLFVGNWNSNAFGLEMKSKYKKFSNIKMVDPIYDPSALFALRMGCSLYVHGHSAGGTNPSLVEMMHFAKDIIAFDCNYNRASTEDKADYFLNEEELIDLILNEDAVVNGQSMLEIAERRYTWDVVKEKYYSLFN